MRGFYDDLWSIYEIVGKFSTGFSTFSTMEQVDREKWGEVVENGDTARERQYGLGGYKNWNIRWESESILRDLDTNKYKTEGQCLIGQYKREGT